MLYREIIAVCSEIHTKHINKLCGAEHSLFFLIFNLVVHKVTFMFLCFMFVLINTHITAFDIFFVFLWSCTVGFLSQILD